MTESEKSSSGDSVVSTMDLYVRMSNDSEKDYCFNVPSDEKISWLFKIFDTLPMILSPSYFYDARPEGFAVSRAPGWLTAGGAILFAEGAEKPKNIAEIPLSSTFRQSVWPGQLIIPVWKYNYRRWATVVGILAFWLYLDLPDCVSPTPGHQPTVLALHLAERMFPAFKTEDPEPSIFDGIAWQWGFFAMHVLKVLFIYLLFWVGGINPISMNMLKARQWKQQNQDINKDDLLAIGWTSARRATPLEWREEYRKSRVDAEGGILQAYHAGTLDDLKVDPGLIELGPGEGWATVKSADSDNIVLDDLKSQDTVTLSNVYIEAYYEPLVDVLFAEDEKEAVSSEDAAKLLKDFRRVGPLPPKVSKTIAQLYERRKAATFESPKDK